MSIRCTRRLTEPASYTRGVPRLWSNTIEAHRHAVRDAIIHTTAELAGTDGLRSVTMSRIAEKTGIGRATLYKYFADVDAIMLAWHERQITGHLHQLTAAGEQPGTPVQRLEAVLHAYALISHASRKHRESELAGFLHGDPQVARAENELRQLVRRLVADAVASGEVRDDVAADELVNYCLHALTAAVGVPSIAAVRRLVAVTLAGMRAPDRS